MAIESIEALPTGIKGKCLRGTVDLCQLRPMKVISYTLFLYFYWQLFRQCFMGMCVRGFACSSQSSSILACVLGQLVGSQENIGRRYRAIVQENDAMCLEVLL